MRILITGAQGMLGHDLMQEFGQKNEVLAADLKEFDITDVDASLMFIESAQPDLVIHAAAYTQVDKCEVEKDLAFQVNATGAGNIARICATLNCPMVYFSSDYVFDGQSEVAYSEDDGVNSISEYGKSKLAGELEVREALPQNHLILRTAWLYGLHGPNFVNTMIRLAEERAELRVVHDQTGCPTWTRDLAKGTSWLINANARGTFHVTNSGQATWCDFAQFFLARISPGVTVKPICTADFPRPARRPAFSVLSNSKFKSITGRCLPDWHDAVIAYLEKKYPEMNRRK